MKELRALKLLPVFSRLAVRSFRPRPALCPWIPAPPGPAVSPSLPIRPGLAIRLVFFVCLLLGWIQPGSGQSLGRFSDRPDRWFRSPEARAIADNMLLFQRNAGGWPKGKDYQYSYSTEERAEKSNNKIKRDCTFDNGATYTELNFLASVCFETKESKYKSSFNRGLDYILEAQYANGGWPQYYPESHKIWSRANSKWSPGGIEHFITFNDNVMTGILQLLKKVAEGKGSFAFIDEGRRKRARTALERGIDCILKTQFYYDGRKTGWPAQVDEISFEPRWGRTFEPPSIAAKESTEVIRFLMSIENPGKKVIQSIQSAVKWMDEVKILHTRLLEGDTLTITEKATGIVHTGRRDTYLEHDKNAPPLWARFYELNTFRPVFCSRNDTVKYQLANISLERRSGYDWYGYWPATLLTADYPDWCEKNQIENVLK